MVPCNISGPRPSQRAVTNNGKVNKQIHLEPDMKSNCLCFIPKLHSLRDEISNVYTESTGN